LCLTPLIYSLQEQLAPTVGHEIVLYHPLSPKMVSTRSRARVNKQVEADPSGPANITSDLAAILDGQAKMQQELTDLKKRSADEMEALRQENSRLKRKIEADPTQKGKAKETSEAAGSPTFQPTEEKSEYNPTPHTFTTTQQTPILSAHPTHFHSTLPGHTAAPTAAATLPTTHVPSTCHHPTYHSYLTLQPSQPPYYPHPSSQLHLHFSHPRPPSHTSSPASIPPTQTSSPFHRLHRQHPPSHPVGTLHTGALHWWNRPRRTPQSLHNTCRPLHFSWRSLLQSFPYHPQRPRPWMVHHPPIILYRQLRHPLTYVYHSLRWQSPASNYYSITPRHQTRTRRDAPNIYRSLQQGCSSHPTPQSRDDIY